MRLARHFVEQRHGGRIRRLACETGLEARAHRPDLPGELLAQTGKIARCIFSQQKRSRGLQRDRLSDFFRIFGHPHRDCRNCIGKTRKVCVAQCTCFLF